MNKGLGILSALVAVFLVLNCVVIYQLSQEPTVVEKEVVVNNTNTIVQVVEKEVAVQDPRIDDLYEREFSDEYSDIEEAAELAVMDEIEEDDYEMIEDMLSEMVVGFDELEDVDVKDIDVKVTALGLDEDEDKIANVVVELRVKYTTEEGADIEYKKTLVLNATVTFDEGDLSEEKVVFN